MRRLASIAITLAGVLAVAFSASAAETLRPVIVDVHRIWDAAPHNAFTDLLRHQGRWYCVFREGAKHVSPDGALRVLSSEDGRNWKSLALLQREGDDLRDAKISVTPDGRLMLNGAAMRAKEDIRYRSLTWFSEDRGETWSEGVEIGDPGFWLWRVQWHQGRAYSLGYLTDRDRERRFLRLYASDDGREFRTHIAQVEGVRGVGEDKILFREDDSALCLLRHETGTKGAYLGKSQPPYSKWSWTDLGVRVGGPDMIELPDGRIVAVTRLYQPQQRTSLSQLDPDAGTLTELVALPSGGDTSYAGLVLHDGLLWISYYSSHEEKTAIYLARVRFE